MSKRNSNRSIIAFIVVLIVVILLGFTMSNINASGESLENQSNKTNNKNVMFDAFFKESSNTAKHSVVKDINAENTNLYLNMNVNKGYLKNAVITLGEDSNFMFKSNQEKVNLTESIGNRTVALEQINAGSNETIEIPITTIKNKEFNLKNLNKNSVVKLEAVYVNENGVEEKIEKSITLNLAYTSNLEIALSEEVNRFIPYTVNGKTGLIVQTVINSGLVNNSLPLESSNIITQALNINGIKPKEVKVTALTTEATSNNADVINFSNDNWKYNEETGLIEINIENAANENVVKWNTSGMQNVLDQYMITYVFDEEAIKTITDAGVKFNLNTKSKLDIYTNEGITTKNKEFTNEVVLTEKLNDLISYSIDTSNKEISKGYMYSNLDGANNETIYNSLLTANVGYADMIDSINMIDIGDRFLTEDQSYYNTVVSGKNIVRYKQTIISKENFDRILGENGFINIYNVNNELIALINKDMEVNQDGNYVFNYDNIDVNVVRIETSKPITEGLFKIENVKSINTNIEYGKDKVKNFMYLEQRLNGTAKSMNSEILSETYNTITKLNETYTKAELEISNNNLSTIMINENVNLTVILKTDSLENDLFKNPVLEIELPEYIEDIDVKDVNLMHDDQLKIVDAQKFLNEKGNIVIRFIIEGNQTQYNVGSITKGTNIVITSNIKVKELSPTSDTSIKLKYSNEKANAMIDSGYVELPIKISAPETMVTMNTFLNYQDNDVVTSIEDEEVGKLPIKAESKIVTTNITIMNNNKNASSNVSILGRTPFKGNKSLENGEDLGTTFDGIVKSQIRSLNIDQNNLEVYYSENGNATDNLNDANNKWTKEIDLSKVKSYLIVVKNYELKVGEKVSFEYDIEIPAGLEYNESTFSTYVVNYENQEEGMVLAKRNLGIPVGYSTGEGPNLEVGFTSNMNVTGIIKESEEIKYTVSVKNKGTKNADQVVVKYVTPKGLYSVTSNNITIGTILPGETKTAEIVLKAETISYRVAFGNANPGMTPEDFEGEDNELEPNGVEANHYYLDYKFSAKVAANKLEQEIVTNEISTKVTKKQLNVTTDVRGVLENGGRPNVTAVQPGSKVEYTMNLFGVTGSQIQNMVIKFKLPEGSKYIDASFYDVATQTHNKTGVTYDSANNTIVYDKSLLKPGELITVSAIVEFVKTDKTSIDTIGQFIINANEIDEVKGPESKLPYTRGELKWTFSSSKPSGNLNFGDTIEYLGVIENTGKGTIEKIKIVDTLPEGLIYTGSSYKIDGSKAEVYSNENNVTTLEFSLEPNQKIEFNIKAKVQALKEDRNIENYITITTDDTGEIKSNVIKHKILKTDNEITEPEIPGTQRISGLAWVDLDQDGARGENETLLENMPVWLIESETGVKIQESKTNSTGEYTFRNVEKGKYIVTFLYSAGEYDLTAYKKEGVNESLSSKAIASKVTIEGVEREAAITDTITINDEHITNMNIGLVASPKFDLKLDKYVSKVTVTDSKGTNAFDFNNSKLAKVELDGKVINTATVLIEYKVVVTNNGAIDGYAKKIVDYMENGLTFNSTLNPDWYVGENNYLFNSSLSNTKLASGESKTLTLILSKKMNKENTGIVNNTAEIAEDANDLNIKDYNSIPNNKKQGENDMSSADLIIGIKTGSIILYIGITLIVIAILGIGTQLINKKVLKSVER